MKKIIAAAAGLMIAGAAMATVASAAVEFSGDARARYYYQDNYTLSDGDDAADHWNSRVRLNVKATTAGGSYAKVRLVMQDSAWGNEGQNDSTVDVDRAFVGVPLGCVELTAGRQPLSLTTGYWNDVDLDNVRLKYAQDGTTVIGWYAVLKAEKDVAAASGESEYKDSEDRLYGIAVMHDFADWNVAAGVSYQDMDLTDITLPNGNTESGGAMATIAVSGPAGPVAFAAEFGWQEDGVIATDEQDAMATGDDGFGGYFSAGMDFDAFGLTLVGGATTDGFAFDVPVGFVMIGGDNQITPNVSNVVGYYGDEAADTYFIGLKSTYQASEDLGFGFNLAYANIETADGSAFDTAKDGEDDGDLFEVSATAGYAINDGTMLYGRLGYLDVDFQDDPIFGAGVSLELAF